MVRMAHYLFIFLPLAPPRPPSSRDARKGRDGRHIADVTHSLTISSVWAAAILSSIHSLTPWCVPVSPALDVIDWTPSRISLAAVRRQPDLRPGSALETSLELKPGMYGVYSPLACSWYNPHILAV